MRTTGGDMQIASRKPCWLLCVVVSFLLTTAHAQTCSDMPKCDRCFLETISKSQPAVRVCKTCSTGYSIINNGRACGCPPGRFDSGGGCQDCGALGPGFYCPGAPKKFVATPDDTADQRGPRLPCNKDGSSGLTTLITRAAKWDQCVTLPGYKLKAVNGTTLNERTQAAVVCEVNKYNPGRNRLAVCLPCPSGLKTIDDSEDPQPWNHDGRDDCKIPPGSYLGQQRPQLCPKGTYRSGFAERNLPTQCTPCEEGITTEGVGATSIQACNVVEPGFAALWNESGQHAMEATPCPIGTYSIGGPISAPTNCTSCEGYTTKDQGSSKQSDCLAPPGYYLNHVKKVLERCPLAILASSYDLELRGDYGTFGTYRRGWAATPNGVADCNICGANMKVMPQDPNEHPDPEERERYPTVATSSSSCYISPGQGLIKDFSLNSLIFQNSDWKAVDCPNTTIGAADFVFGTLTAVVCKPITTVCGKNYDYSLATDTCLNPAGYGAYPKEAIECTDGSYAAPGSLKPCQVCSAGRATKSEPWLKQSVLDCFVKKGYGVFNHKGLTEDDRWITSYVSQFSLSALPIEGLATLEAAECPVGRYSSSQEGQEGFYDLFALCLPCPVYSTTETTGASSYLECNVCVPGAGTQAGQPWCDLCPRGTYNNGMKSNPLTGAERTNWDCLSCPSMTFSLDGHQNFTSAATTMQRGATSDSDCVPVNGQLSVFAGTVPLSITNPDELFYILGLIVVPNAYDLEACVNHCESEEACHFVVHNVNGTCFAFIPPTTYDGVEVFYKLPPSNDIRVASIQDNPGDNRTQSKSISSGLYAKYVVATGIEGAWGSSIGYAQTAPEAAEQCDANAFCYGFTKVPGQYPPYQLRTGSTVQGMRTVINAMKTGPISEDQQYISNRIVQPGRYDQDVCKDDSWCNDHGDCYWRIGCVCRPGWVNGPQRRCEYQDPNPCAQYETRWDKTTQQVTEPVFDASSSADNCLKHLWTKALGCTNPNYVDSNRWDLYGKTYTEVYNSLYEQRRLADEVYNSWTWAGSEGLWFNSSAQVAAAQCYGIAYANKVGALDIFAYENSLPSGFTYSFHMICPRRSRISAIRLGWDSNYDINAALVINCSNFNVNPPAHTELPLVGTPLEAVSTQYQYQNVSLGSGVYMGLQALDMDVSSQFYLTRFVAIEGPWSGAQKELGPVPWDNSTTVRSQCSDQELAVGLWGDTQYDYTNSGMYTLRTIGLICQNAYGYID